MSYIHGTEPSEQQRLAELNRLTNAEFIAFLEVRPGQQVLEVGSGLGILASSVADAAANVHVTGVEYAPAQLDAAARHPRVRYIRGDAHHLEFPDATFDLVYVRYVLEHLQYPDIALAEMRRVVRPGGHVAVCENDTSLVRLDPPCPTFDRVWATFQLYQARLRGDSLIGRRLYRLCRSAGFTDITLSVQPEVHWHGSPAFAPWVTNLVGNVESARAGLIATGMAAPEIIDAAVSELTSLLSNDTASATFAWNRARAVR
ncbi:MAG: methyltransferase domain-containing protein [Vicinamibacterales bacterium]